MDEIVDDSDVMARAAALVEDAIGATPEHARAIKAQCSAQGATAR